MKLPNDRKSLTHLGIGLLVTVLLIIAKSYFENAYHGQWFNARGYEILHSFIPIYNSEEELPVMVLDISDLQSDSSGIPPNNALKEIIEALIQSKAKAIAIDIDYSTKPDPQNPSNYVARTEENNKFFDFLHEERKKGVPIFVGAGNVGVEPKTWLNLTKNKDLAASLSISSNNDTTEVRSWLQCDENNPETKLNSISTALADASGKRPQPPDWLKPFLKDYEEKENLRTVEKTSENKNKVACLEAFTLVNYAKLELIQKLSLQTLNKDSVLWAKNTEGISKFQDKLVIIGDARGKEKDSFVVIGRNKTVSGVFIHASATYTVVADPVYKFSHWSSILLDALLGLFIVFGLYIFRRKYSDKEDSSHTLSLWENRFISFSIFITLLLGFFMVKFYNVLWLDFLLVIFALLLHSRTQKVLTYIPKKIFGGAEKADQQTSPVNNK